MKPAWPLPESPDQPGRELAECIIAVASSGDHEAFARLFRHFAPRVKAYLLTHGAGPATAEDLAQETLVTLWRKAAFFDPARAGAATWVFSIARNLWIDALRRERYPSALRELASPGEGQPDGDEQAAGAERERLVAQALRNLPAEQAEVVRLSFFEDISHTEIEDRLGLPLGTVKSRLRLAMHRLRLTLGGKV